MRQTYLEGLIKGLTSYTLLTYKGNEVVNRFGGKMKKGFEIPTGLMVSWQRSRELVKKMLTKY